MSPSLEIISQSKEGEIDRNILKIVILALFTIGSSFGVVYFFNQYLVSSFGPYFWASIFTALFFFVLFILNIFFIKSLWRINVIVFFASFAPLGLFWFALYPKVSVPLVVAAGLFFVFLFSAASQGAHYLENGLKIKFWLTAKMVLPKAVTGLLIFLSVLIYLNYFEWGRFNEKLGQSLLGGILAGTEPILRLQFGDVSFSQNVDLFLTRVTEAQLKKIKLDLIQKSAGGFQLDFNTLTSEARAQVLKEATTRLKSSLEKTLGPLSASAEVKSVVYGLISGYIGKLSAQTKLLLSLFVIILIFFSLKGVAVLFYWFIIFIAFVFFKFLIIVGFAYVTVESRSREFVLLD